MTWPQYLRRECTACGFLVRLSVMQAEILIVLMLRYPGSVTLGELIEAVWHDAQWSDGDAEPLTAEGSILSAIRDLRGKIGGFHLQGRKGFGYRLIQRPGE